MYPLACSVVGLSGFRFPTTAAQLMQRHFSCIVYAQSGAGIFGQTGSVAAH